MGDAESTGEAKANCSGNGAGPNAEAAVDDEQGIVMEEPLGPPLPHAEVRRTKCGTLNCNGCKPARQRNEK